MSEIIMRKPSAVGLSAFILTEGLTQYQYNYLNKTGLCFAENEDEAKELIREVLKARKPDKIKLMEIKDV